MQLTEIDVKKIATPFRLVFLPNAQLNSQCPSKVPVHYGDDLKNLPKELENIMF